jgi:thioredoxin reductase
MISKIEKTLELLPSFIFPKKINVYCSECEQFLRTESGCAYLGIGRNGVNWTIDYHTVERNWSIITYGKTILEASEKMLELLKKKKLLKKNKI